MTKISIVIPCWKEDLEAALFQIDSLHHYKGVEWVLAMVSPPDGWREKVEGVRADHFSLVDCLSEGRGLQMNAGAEQACGEYLLFHHCDTLLTEEHLASLESLMNSECNGGAYHRALDERYGLLRHTSPLLRWYNERWGVLFGDQSVFVKRAFFIETGGFKPLKLMEDVEFSKRLRKAGCVILLDPPINSSGRRGDFYGSLKMTLINLMMLFLFKMGVSADALHAMYYKGWNIKGK